ncbi:MAG: hypothetical protein KJO12_06065, partial [Ignavibacteria bacterium]|nr:hypothetical protein [Ignavibacteria bacterium]
IELEVDNKKIDSTDIYRSFLSKDVKADTLNHELLEGILYRPSNSKVDGIVIVLAGSDGGITSADWRASLLASNGIPSLALAFFDYKNLPQDLIELPLEYLSNAIGYLKETENFEKVGLMGFSKGSELVLAYCSKVPDNTIDAIIAISPSAYIWQGINSKVDVKSSWTYQKLPLDFIPWKYNEEVIKMLQSDGPKKFRTLYEYSLMASDNQENVIKAALDLGYSDAPVLLIAGTDDGSWPAAEMVNKLSEKLIESNYKNKFEKLILDEAGHLIFFDFLPVTDSQKQSGQIFGGTIEANIGARKKAWNYVYSFLLQEMN